LAPTALLATSFTAGQASPNLTFTFTNKATAPGVAKIRAVDTDGVSSAAGVEAVPPMRSGRARLANALGSDRLDLPMVFRAEYWASAAAGWVTNTSDSCTTANLALAAASTPSIVGSTCVLESVNNSGAGCAAAPSVANRAYLEGGVTGTDSAGVAGFAGNFNLWLKAPGAGTAGSVDVTATVPAWLQFNWTGTVANPKGRATFGVYRSPLLYRRENY